jgi:hypothetical protein
MTKKFSHIKRPVEGAGVHVGGGIHSLGKLDAQRRLIIPTKPVFPERRTRQGGGNGSRVDLVQLLEKTVKTIEETPEYKAEQVKWLIKHTPSPGSYIPAMGDGVDGFLRSILGDNVDVR